MSRKTLGMISGKVRVANTGDLDPNRFEFLDLSNAEPNPGAPSSDNGLLSSGADGSRAWLIPNQGLSVSLSNDLFVDETGVPIDTSVYNYSSSNTLSDVLVDLDQAIANAVAGSLDSVATDSTINGDGTTNNPLSVALGGDAETLGGELPSFYLNYDNFTNTPTIGDGTITISAGTGLSGTSAFTTNQSSNETITLDNTDKGSDQNIFKNVAVSGQNTLVADSNNDTLNIVGGSSINITTDAATDTLTIDFDGTEDNNYVDSVSFDNTTGDLTLTRNGSLSDLTASLDGRYLLEGAKAADADLLDGEDGTYYLDYNNFTNTPTLYTSSDFDVDFSNKSTSDLSEGTNLYYTDTRVRSAVSASGDLSYDSATGVFSYTERTDQQIRNLFSASGDLNYDSSTGEFSVTVPPGYDSSDFDTDFSNKSTDDLSEGTTNLYYTDTRARNSLSASGDLDYNASTGTLSFTERTDQEVRDLFSGSTGIDYNSETGSFSLADTTVTAGEYGSASQVPVITIDSQGRITDATTTNVAGVSAFAYNSSTGELDIDTADGSTFSATVTLDPFSTSDLSEGTNLYYTDSRARNALSASGDLSYDSATGTFSFTERTDQEVRDLFSASGDLSYNSSTGEFSVTTYKSADFDADFASKSTSDLTEGTNLYYTDERVRNALSASGDLSYNSSTGNFSVTTYKTSDFNDDFNAKDTDDLSEGSSSLYFTTDRARDSVSASGDLSYNSSTGVFSFTERTDQEVRDLFSASGDLSYNDSTGTFSVTTYKTSDFNNDFSSKDTDDLTEGSSNLYFTTGRIDSHLSGGTGVTYSNGNISIGQDVATSSNVSFEQLTLGSGVLGGVDPESHLRIAYPGNWSDDQNDDQTALYIQTNGSNDSDFPYGVVGIRFATSTASDYGPFIGGTRTGSGNGDFVVKTGGSNVQERFRIADNGSATFSSSVSASSFSGDLNYNDITNPPTIGDGTLTVSGGSGLSGSGTFSANQTANTTISVDHADTSSVSNLSPSSRVYVTGLSFDTFGHVTSVSTQDESEADVSTLQFFLADGSRSDISLTAANELPFFLADGTQNNIPLSA